MLPTPSCRNCLHSRTRGRSTHPPLFCKIEGSPAYIGPDNDLATQTTGLVYYHPDSPEDAKRLDARAQNLAAACPHYAVEPYLITLEQTQEAPQCRLTLS